MQPSRYSEPCSGKSDRPAALSFGYEALRSNPTIATFVQGAEAAAFPFFHHLSPVLRGLPLKSALLDEPQSLKVGVEECRWMVDTGHVSPDLFEFLLVCIFLHIA